MQEANFADSLLSKWPSFRKYYGIDPWTQQQTYVDSANVNNAMQNVKYENAKQRLRKYENRIELIRKYSSDAHMQFEDNSIDFIYIDGRHDYCGVYEDLQLYYPKLKCNGIMAGHDFHTVEEVRKVSSDNYEICANGSHVLINGGGVKGKNLIKS